MARVLSSLVLGIVSVLTAPYRRTFKLYTWKPIKEMRETAGDRKDVIQQIRDWKANKYQELQSVQVAASFCAGVTLATLSWTKIPHALWISEALWFSSLVCSIWAVITSIQAKSILDDLPDRDRLTSTLPEDELKRTKRVILRFKKKPGLGHWVMIFVWQFPSMTMSYAWCTFLSGLSLYVCTPLIQRAPWSNRHRIALVHLTTGGLCMLTYLFSSAFVYASEMEHERSRASTRTNTDVESVSGDPPNSDPIQGARAKVIGGNEDNRDVTEGLRRSARPRLLI